MLTSFVHRGRIVSLSGPPGEPGTGCVLTDADVAFYNQQVHEGYMIENTDLPVFYVDIERALETMCAMFSANNEVCLRVFRRESEGADYVRTNRVLHLVAVDNYLTVRWDE